MFLFLLQQLGLLCCFVYISSAVLSDDCEANRKGFNDSIRAVGRYWISNDKNQDERDIKALLYDISEVIALQEDTLNALESNWNQSEGQVATNQKEGLFLELVLDLVNLFREEENVLTHRNYSYCDKVENNTIEECEKFFQIMWNATQLVDRVMSVIQSKVLFMKLDDGFTEERKKSNTFTSTSLQCIMNEYEAFIKLSNSINKNMCDALNLTTFVELRTKFHVYCNISYDVESFNSHSNTKHYEEKKVKLILFSSFGVFFLIVGLPANFVLFLTFLKHEEMRTAPNLMIMSLTVTDFLNLFFSVFIYYLVEVCWNWGFSEIVCKLYFLLLFTLMYVGVYSVVGIHIQRCVALKSISNPQAPQRSARRRRLRFALMIIAVWAISFLLAAYPALRTTIRNKQCSFMKEGEQFKIIFKKVQFNIFFVIPFIIIVITSLVTVRLLNKSIPGERIGLERLMRERMLSSGVVIALTLVYAFTYGTHNIILFAKLFYPEILNPVTKVTYIITFANPSLNPIALFVASRKFRGYMKKYLLFWKSSSDDNVNPATIATNAKIRNTRV